MPKVTGISSGGTLYTFGLNVFPTLATFVNGTPSVVAAVGDVIVFRGGPIGPQAIAPTFSPVGAVSAYPYIVQPGFEAQTLTIGGTDTEGNPINIVMSILGVGEEQYAFGGVNRITFTDGPALVLPPKDITAFGGANSITFTVA